ncbi:MAG: response regulator [Bacteroidia bacterium]|nr:response regulator [Bacteroidia bacterium]
MKRILILDDNLTICLMLKSWLTKKNYNVDTATGVEEAKQKVKNEAFDLILSDIRMPDADGFTFLSWVKKFDSDILVIMMTSYADIESVVESMKAGAVDYIAKPIEAENLYKKIADALKNQENQKKAAQFGDPLRRPSGKIYDKIFDKLHDVIHNDSHLLVFGGPGTGKTSVAKYIYTKSRRGSGPFVIIDLDPQVVSWNGDRGAAEKKFREALEKAKGGLLLIKNFQKTDINLQTQLIKALTTQKKDDNYTQIIITTKESKEQLRASLLPKLIELLKDLHVELPNLQGNDEAILFYAQSFLDAANKELDKKIKKIDNEVLEAFFNHTWIGNIQELKNVIFKASLLTEGDTITKKLLTVLFKNFTEDVPEVEESKKQAIEGLKKENYEKEKIAEALEIAKGNKTVAASILNIDRKTLYNKIKLYNVEIN